MRIVRTGWTAVLMSVLGFAVAAQAPQPVLSGRVGMVVAGFGTSQDINTFQVALRTQNGTTLTGPLTLRGRLPVGLTPSGFTLGTNWSGCSVDAMDARAFSCTRATDHGATLSGVYVHFLPPFGYDIGNGFVEGFVANIAAADFTPPPLESGNCFVGLTENTSESGCVGVIALASRPALRVPDFRINPLVFDAGGTATITAEVELFWFTGRSDAPGGMVTVEFDLPPGLTPTGFTASMQGWTCGSVSPGLARCTSTNPPEFSSASNIVTFGVGVSIDAGIPVPGPLLLQVRTGNSLQALMSSCPTDNSTPGCRRLSVATTAPPQASLAIVQTTHAGEPMWIGSSGQRISVDVANLGNGASSVTRLQLQLPGGFVLEGAQGGFSCTQQGDPVAGPTRLLCEAQGLAAQGQAGSTKRLDLDVSLLVREVDFGPLPVHASVDAAASASAAVLEACIAQPAQAHCDLDLIGIAARCKAEFEGGIYCNGYETEANAP